MIFLKNLTDACAPHTSANGWIMSTSRARTGGNMLFDMINIGIGKRYVV